MLACTSACSAAPSERTQTLAGLDAAHGLLQQAIARELRMKRTPDAQLLVRRVDRAGHAHLGAARRMTVATEQDQVVAALRQAERLLLTTHENPDGDALGSLLAMHLILEQLGKDSADVHLARTSSRCPGSTATGPSTASSGAPPDDLDERAIVFLDCGNIDRMPVDFLQREGLHILNIDHHHDNTRFGTREPRGARGVVHGGDRLAAGEGAGRRAHAGDRRARSTRGSSRTPAASCTRTPAWRRTAWRPT